ncbi:MAG: leucine-rich repeat protein [Lentimicrobiaceae bacterium]|nr:leucine-rich repeat protein [Lentimicrobiaceae bacterium]
MKQRNRLFAMTFCLCTVAFSGKTTAQVTTIDSGMCGANLTWWFTSDNTLTVSGSGDMKSGSSPWVSHRDSIVAIVIDSGVTTIGNSAFSYCRNLISVRIGSSVTSLGNNAFTACDNLDTIICKAIIPPVISGGLSTFCGIFSTINVIIPCGTLNAYQTSFWNDCWSGTGANFIEDCPPSISGKIMRQDSTLLSSGSVELYQIQSPSPYPLIDVVPIDSNGNYLFTNVSADSCIIRAVPDSSENALPTYYGNTDLWNLASPVVVGGSLQNMDIEIIPQSSLSNGSSFISGYVGQKDGQKSLSQKSVSDPAEDVCVYLQKESLASTWTTIDYTLTNAEGYFEFRNVSAGRYRVILDVPGLETDNPQIVEVGDGDTIQNIEYEITEGGITNKSGDVGISNYELGMMNYVVYPNPTTGKLTVFSSQLSEIGGEVEIYDVVGQVVFTTTVSPQFPEMIIDISGLSAGLYFLKVDGKVLKVVKE